MTSFTSTKETLDRAAEVFWKVACDESQQVSRQDTPAYEHAAELVEALYYQAYPDADSDTWQHVRGLLADLGPDDSLAGQPGLQGIASYHAAAMADRAETLLEDARESFRRGLQALASEAFADYHDARKGDQTWDRSRYEDFRNSLEDITRDVLFSR